MSGILFLALFSCDRQNRYRIIDIEASFVTAGEKDENDCDQVFSINSFESGKLGISLVFNIEFFSGKIDASGPNAPSEWGRDGINDLVSKLELKVLGNGEEKSLILDPGFESDSSFHPGQFVDSIALKKNKEPNYLPNGCMEVPYFESIRELKTAINSNSAIMHSELPLSSLFVFWIPDDSISFWKNKDIDQLNFEIGTLNASAISSV